MTTHTLTEQGGALRLKLTESDWLAVGGGLRDLTLPSILLPSVETVADYAAKAGVDPVSRAAFDALDPAVKEALRMQETALLRADVQISVRGAGMVGVFWTDGRSCASLVRRITTTPDGIIPGSGVLLSVFRLSNFVEEILRHVPFPAEQPDVAPATVAEDVALALGSALREGRSDIAAVIAERAGLSSPPAVVASLARGMVGDLVITISGPRGVGGIRLWLCDAGWVEMRRLPSEEIEHVPTSRDLLETALASELTAALEAIAHRGKS